MFVLMVVGGWWESFKQEGDGPGGMCRGKSGGLRVRGRGAEKETEEGWSEKQEDQGELA